VVTAVIYSATDLKDRRVQVLDDAGRGRALVRAVDGMALVFTRLAELEVATAVSAWSIALRRISKGAVPAELRWLRLLDDEDRAEFIEDMWEQLENASADADGTRGIDTLVAQWRATANALADPERRQVLLGSVSQDDFVPVARHS
jgi:hypothetical protein